MKHDKMTMEHDKKHQETRTKLSWDRPKLRRLDSLMAESATAPEFDLFFSS